ncbi:MAG: hypothetical protein COT73_13165 [Bdellovibrio sp. CG10_big_fil_rev_8_21_14_0_10_47_8]|nr:MAG: hypothetical protein COT73_13165 [Bdellovibrio sp. CG10_big_fil_rev_8_21_14_0_10_47_8]
MKLQIATPEDNAQLIELYKEFPVKGLVDLKVDRKQDFFAAYKTQTEDFKTYTLRDDEDKIHGMASFIFRDTYYENHQVRIATATDLRIRPNRQAILDWAHHFLPVIRNEINENETSSIFSIINLSDSNALNTFIRPRTMKRAMPRYHLYRRFHMVSLHGRYPWAPKPVPSIKIRTGSPATLDALIEYIVRRSQYRPFASVWDEASFHKKMARLKGLKLSDFLIAFDSLDNVIGCLAPWSAADIQDLIPLRYSLRGHNFRQFLKFFWLFGMTRRLAKPVVSTGIETPLQFRYLTHVFADNEDIFESLLYQAFENASPQEFLLYAHTDQDFRLLPPESWISASLPYALYSVVPPEREMPSFLHPSVSLNPEIEAYSVI